jgi:hypothetical protein
MNLPEYALNPTPTSGFGPARLTIIDRENSGVAFKVSVAGYKPQPASVNNIGSRPPVIIIIIANAFVVVAQHDEKVLTPAHFCGVGVPKSVIYTAVDPFNEAYIEPTGVAGMGDIPGRTQENAIFDAPVTRPLISRTDCRVRTVEADFDTHILIRSQSGAEKVFT